MIRVLAIDPGERVGWAIGEIDPDGPSLNLVDHGISTLKEFGSALHRTVVVEKNYDVVIYETWRLSGRDPHKFVGNDMKTSQLIGMIRLCAWVSGTTLVSQPPGDKNAALERTTKHEQAAVIREVLDRMPKSHDDAHDGDAIGHLWQYYWRKYL